jgi:hypothetical protein
MDTAQDLARIRDLNDAFRKTFAGGKMVMTASVAAAGNGQSIRAGKIGGV